MFQIKLKTGLHYVVVYTQQDTQRSFQSTRKRVYLFFVFCIYLYCFHFSEVQTSLWFHIPKDCSLSQPGFNPSRLHTAKCNQSDRGVRGQCQAEFNLCPWKCSIQVMRHSNVFLWARNLPLL